MNDNDYFRRRAVDELAAAEWATSPQAKRAHRDLAIRYLQKIENGSPVLEVTPPVPALGSRLSV
jgi:hypothetical protein